MFEQIHAQVAALEGGYSNHPADRGGETIFGISRVAWPNWEGWAMVDSCQDKTMLTKNAELHALAKAFYKRNFWDVFNLDAVNNQALAFELYEQAVNLGVGQATRNLQRVLNALNKNYFLGPDLGLDGVCGQETRSRVLRLTQMSDQHSQALVNGLNCLQGSLYVNLGNNKLGQRVFTLGWLSKRAGS